MKQPISNSLQQSFQKIKLCPDAYQIYFHIGHTFLSLGETQKAFKACLKGIEYGGDGRDDILYWANLMYNSGLLLEAGDLYRLVLSHSSTDPEICCKLATCLRSIGEVKEAQALEAIALAMAQTHSSFGSI
ncbi:hypothetical protein POG22_01410 [Geitlerinema sp. CS-897]|nr:hypothetical protein [Geitlerinema sp. CS-897]